MMREVLFRAKAINRDKGNRRTSYNNGDWVYGLITRLYDERFEKLPAEMTDVNGVNGLEIDHKTITQYICKTDCNGTKIFEGDIVRVGDDIGKVVYNESEAMYEIELNEGDSDFGYTDFTCEPDCDIEVIGNVFDTPELMEGE